MAALKEEEEQRSQTVKRNIDKITIQMASVWDTITAIEKQIQGEDLPFLLVNELLQYMFKSSTVHLFVWQK